MVHITYKYVDKHTGQPIAEYASEEVLPIPSEGEFVTVMGDNHVDLVVMGKATHAVWPGKIGYTYVVSIPARLIPKFVL